LNAIAEFSIIPIGVGVSISKYVAICEEVLRERAIKHELHANGTNMEGDFMELMYAINECHQRLHQIGVIRISTIIKIGTRIDKTQTMEQKVDSVFQKMEE